MTCIHTTGWRANQEKIKIYKTLIKLKFMKINPHEKSTGSQFAKLNPHEMLKKMTHESKSMRKEFFFRFSELAKLTVLH